MCAEFNWYLEAAHILPTLFVAAIAACIAWQQLETATAKLNIDLFEKRIAIFNETWEAASSIRVTSEPTMPKASFTNLFP